jgi:hypothetical protein
VLLPRLASFNHVLFGFCYLQFCGLAGNPLACPEPSAVVQDCGIDSC